MAMCAMAGCWELLNVPRVLVRMFVALYGVHEGYVLLQWWLAHTHTHRNYVCHINRFFCLQFNLGFIITRLGSDLFIVDQVYESVNSETVAIILYSYVRMCATNIFALYYIWKYEMISCSLACYG